MQRAKHFLGRHGGSDEGPEAASRASKRRDGSEQRRGVFRRAERPSGIECGRDQVNFLARIRDPVPSLSLPGEPERQQAGRAPPWDGPRSKRQQRQATFILNANRFARKVRSPATGFHW
jgi:hypothetical protein